MLKLGSAIDVTGLMPVVPTYSVRVVIAKLTPSRRYTDLHHLHDSTLGIRGVPDVSFTRPQGTMRSASVHT